MFVDGQAWFTADSVETDAPVSPDDRLYEATDTHVVGVTAEGASFEFAFVGGQWVGVEVDKPVEQWTQADFDAMEAQYPTGYGYSLAESPVEVDPPNASEYIFTTLPSTGLLDLTHDFLNL